MDKNSYQREFNPKRRVYALQEYQVTCPKTTEKKISKLELAEPKNKFQLGVLLSLMKWLDLSIGLKEIR